MKTVREDSVTYKAVLGANYLSDREVICALFLPYGEDRAQTIASKLFADNRTLLDVLKLDADELYSLALTAAQVATLSAVRSIHKRKELSEVKKGKQIVASRDSYNILKPYLEGLNVEHFYVIQMNARNEVLKVVKHSEGGTVGTVVDSKVVFRDVLLTPRVSRIILGHNHPSGNLNPSGADISLTKKLKEAGKSLDIDVLDHLIITDTGYYSFADDGRM